VLAAGTGHDVAAVVESAASPEWRTTGPSLGWDVVRRTTVPSRECEVLRTTRWPFPAFGDEVMDVVTWLTVGDASASVTPVAVPATRGSRSSERTATTAAATAAMARPRPVSYRVCSCGLLLMT
jgi:hypothetical protein